MCSIRSGIGIAEPGVLGCPNRHSRGHRVLEYARAFEAASAGSVVIFLRDPPG
jgi:hypothetical protein